MTPEQLIFDLPIRTAMEREDFLVSPTNQEAVAFIDQWPNWPGRIACLVGPSGSGKTHLARVWQAKCHARILTTGELKNEKWASLSANDAFVLEDGEKGIDEIQLFHFFNAIRRENAFLLLTGERPPTKWRIVLPDLKSRLATVNVVEMQSPDDSLIAGLLVKQFQDRQIQVGPDLIRYLLPRIERSFPGVESVVDRLDKAALQKKSKINVALARDVLKHN